MSFSKNELKTEIINLRFRLHDSNFEILIFTDAEHINNLKKNLATKTPT